MVLESAAFAGGPFVEQFEREFAAFCKTPCSIGVGSGTDALWLTLLALGVGPGDEVITVPNTFLATAEAISFCGAKPIFIDIDERTYTMDPQKLDDYLRTRYRTGGQNGVKAVIPVHLFGHPADMDPILEIAHSYGLFVIEDACQAHGARYKGKPAGSIGDAGCFSFYPGKNLGAYGEAGAVVTHNADLASKIRILRDHGQSQKYYHRFIGWNARMDGFQGAILSVKLKYLEKWNQSRRENADLYNRLLSGLDGLSTAKPADFAEHVYHVYAVRTLDRDMLMSYLARRNIHCGIHYPLPIHLQEAYRILGLGQGTFAVAETCANELLSLPMYPELNKNQIENVAQGIEDFFREKRGN